MEQVGGPDGGSDDHRVRPARTLNRSPGTGRGRRGGSTGKEPAAQPGDPQSLARALCLRLLTTQPRTRAELDAELRKRGFPDETVDTVLDRFTEVGLIDDQAFATAWVESRHHGRGLSRRALRQELWRRGVPTDAAEEALDEVDDDMEEHAARVLVRRRLPSTRTVDPPARVRRLTAMLARKGYPAGLVARVVKEELARELEDGTWLTDDPDHCDRAAVSLESLESHIAEDPQDE